MRTPKTDTQLYDQLVRLFGYGAYDEVTSDVPYWEYRRKEISKVIASRRKAEVSLEEAARIAQYCKVKDVLVTGPHSIWKYRVDARRWWAEHERIQAQAALEDAIGDAVAQEMEEPDSSWLDRLVRATGTDRAEVYAAWQRERQQTWV